jgi:drug/metabolite transporter (DMT)-like permease
MSFHLIILLIGVTIASFSQVLLKKSTEKTYPSRIREYLNPFVICGYGLLFLSLLFSMYSHRGLEYTNVRLIESVGYIIVMFLSYYFFKEKITRRKALGMLVIMAGIYVYYI